MECEPYHADRSLKGKLRRKALRLMHRRPARGRLERPMISFSFDDAPVSAFAAGAQVLERHGVRGVYFVCAGTAGQTGFVGPLGEREHARQAQAAGHEIACHTFSHLDCARADRTALADDLRRNASAFETWGLPAAETFAYPFGEVAGPAKQFVANRFTLARAIHAGLIEPGSDLAQAPAVGIEDEHGEARAMHWIETAIRRRAWVILFTHGVEDALTRYGCTTAALERLVAGALARGMDVVTTSEGVRRMRAAA